MNVHAPANYDIFYLLFSAATLNIVANPMFLKFGVRILNIPKKQLITENTSIDGGRIRFGWLQLKPRH